MFKPYMYLENCIQKQIFKDIRGSKTKMTGTEGLESLDEADRNVFGKENNYKQL